MLTCRCAAIGSEIDRLSARPDDANRGKGCAGQHRGTSRAVRGEVDPLDLDELMTFASAMTAPATANGARGTPAAMGHLSH